MEKCVAGWQLNVDEKCRTDERLRMVSIFVCGQTQWIKSFGTLLKCVSWSFMQ